MRLEGDGVYLREFREEDIGGIREWISDSEVTEYLGGQFSRPQTWEQSERYLAAFLSGDAGGVNFAVADSESGRYIGQCNLLSLDYAARKAEIAVVLTRANIGRGRGAQAVRLLSRYAFETINMRRLYLNVCADNLRAISCYESCGFEREGLMRQHCYVRGAYRDVVIMGLMRAGG